MKNGIVNELITAMKERISKDKILPILWQTFCIWVKKPSIADYGVK